jgi:hypothetical protein
MKHVYTTLAAILCVSAFSGEALAERRVSRAVARAGLESVCPAAKTRAIGSQFFYKNNKPIRDTSRPGAPVVGNNPVMTLAGQVGSGVRLFRGSGKLYASNGTFITSLTPYACAADHCTGRVVSSMATGTARRAVIKASRKAVGYIKIDGGVCVMVPDVGRCYGAGVNMGRPLCDRTVG